MAQTRNQGRKSKSKPPSSGPDSRLEPTEDLDMKSLSDSDTPPQKRQRSKSNVDERTRSEYWFYDGNVILQAEQTLFRVHKTVLSLHSQIFEDTFAIPQASSEQNECIEDCPVVQLTDSADDIKNLLSLLYHSDKTLKFGREVPAVILGSMLRLGRKYVIAHFVKEALEALRNDYPTTLLDWDLLSQDRQPLRIDDEGEPFETHSEIIFIAHEFGLFSILPAVYAKYLQLLDLDDLSNNTNIPKEAREHCITGYVRILGYIKRTSVDALCAPIVLPSKKCSGNGKCEGNSSNKQKIIKDLPVWATEESKGFGVFEDWVSNGLKATENLCSGCRTEARKLTERVRSEFWSLLPTFFGLPTWVDLKDDI